MEERQGNRLLELLQPIRRQLLYRKMYSHIGRFSFYAVCTGMVLLLISYFLPFPSVREAAVLLVSVSTISGFVLAWLWGPDNRQAAAVADRNGLQERVTTALDNVGAVSPFSAAQREDAVKRLQKALPSILKAINVWPFSRKEVYIGGFLFTFWFVLLLSPNSMDSILRQKALERKAVSTVEKKVEETAKKIQENNRLADQQKKEAAKVLDDLKKDLKESRTMTDKLNALETAGKRLDKLQEKANQKQSALADMNKKLAENKMMKEAAAALEKKDKEALLRAMEQVRNQLASLPQKEREEMARLMEEVARKWQESAGKAGEPQAGQLAENLRKAAENIRSGNLPQSYEDMREAMLQALQESGQAEQMNRQLAQAMASLQQSQMTLAAGGAGQPGSAASPGSSTGGTAGTGAPGQSGDSSAPPNSSQSGQGAGGQGTGAGSGNGSGSGSGSGSGTGTGGTGSGTGTGGSAGGQGNGAGTGAGTHEMVNIPSERLNGPGPEGTVGGPLGQGPAESRQSGKSQVSPGVSRPYEEVYQQYEKFARESMDRNEIPADYEKIVKDYFSNIEP
ncbi:hypothetical protein [Aneurinibacillus tyrosinisolvens]|uniref:hypothetical protein n=1 Tax=Aneurinibacillus tyrosinisolvens TaxID=1443435 RepID=UPI00063F1588|nr:hypothetical protein [Aneurinibacillus tyrosinisolvens]